MEYTSLDKNNIIARSNRLLHMKSNPFSLGTLKILDTFLSRINPLDEEGRTVVFTKKEYENLIGVTKINIKDLRKYTDQLQNCKVVLPLPRGGYDSIVLFDRCRVYMLNGENVIELTCSATAKDVFFNLEGVRYIKYQLNNIIQMTSTYAMFLYYYIVENEYRTHWEMSIEEIRQVLHIEPGKYLEMKNFRRFVVDAAVKEVNRLTNYTINCSPIKTGRTITDFEFYIVNVEKTNLIRSTYTQTEEVVDEAYKLFEQKCSMLPEAPTDKKTKALIVKAYNAGVDFKTLFESVSFFIKRIPIPYAYWEYMSFEWVLKNAARIYGLVCDNLTEKDKSIIKKNLISLLDNEVRRVEQRAKKEGKKN